MTTGAESEQPVGAPCYQYQLIYAETRENIFYDIGSLMTSMLRLIRRSTLVGKHNCNTPIKNELDPKKVNLKSGAFVVIMLKNERLTRVRSQKDPRLHFGESFTLKRLSGEDTADSKLLKHSEGERTSDRSAANENQITGSRPAKLLSESHQHAVINDDLNEVSLKIEMD